MGIRIVTILAFISVQGVAEAKTRRIEIVEEIEKKRNQTILFQGIQKESLQNCQSWLAAQKKSLGNRVLTHYCGVESLGTAICTYPAIGEIKYILKKYRTETTEN